MIRAAALLCAVGLAACSNEPEPPANAVTVEVPPAPDAVAVVPSAPLAPGELPTPELDGVAAAGGVWERMPDGARFGPAGGRAIVALRCDAADRQMRILVAGSAAPGTPLRIVTTSAAATYSSEAGSAGAVEAVASADDRFVADALRRADGTIGFQVGDAAVVAVPSDPAIAAVIEGCAG